MPSQDVDAIWAKLKASTAPKSVMAKAAVASTLASAYDSGTKPGRLTLEASTGPRKEHVPAATPLYDSPEQIKQQMARLQEALKSDSVQQRIQSCKQLQELIQHLAKHQQHAVLLQDCMEGSCGKALIARFADKSQVVRETAVSAFTAGLQGAPGAVLTLIPYVFPVLDERIRLTDTVNRQEADDDVRALLAHLVLQLIKLGARALGAYGDEIQGIMAGLLADSYDKVNLLACEALEALNVALGLRLSSIAKQMVAATLPLTTHRKFTVRVAALRAVRATMHQGAHEMILEMIAWRDPNVVPIAAFYGDDLKVNFAGKLATDPHHQVRLEWVITLGDWMLNLRERMDHEPRLLPYLLSALTDPVPTVSSQAVQVLHALGAAYETEHAKELDEATRYLPTAAQGLGWQEALSSSNHQDGSSIVTAVAVVPPPGVMLPESLTQDWGLGVKRVVQGQCGRSLYALLQELFAWQADSRRAAATLLRTMLWLASDAVHQHVHTLIPALCRAVPDPEVQACVVDCMAITAAALPPGLLLGLLVPRLADSQVDISTQAGIIKLLEAVTRGGGQRPDFLPCMATLLDLLTTGEEPLASVKDTQLHGAACDLLTALIQSAGSQGVQQHINKFLVSALYLSNATRCCMDKTDNASGNTTHLSRLAGLVGMVNGSALLQQHLRGFLEYWDPCTCSDSMTAAAVLAQLISAAGMLAPQQAEPTVLQPGTVIVDGSDVDGSADNASSPAAALSAAVQRALPAVCRNMKTSVILLEALQQYFTNVSNTLPIKDLHDATNATRQGHDNSDGSVPETNPWAPALHHMLLLVPDGPPLAAACTCIGCVCQTSYLAAPQLLTQLEHLDSQLESQQQSPGSNAAQGSIVQLLCNRACESPHASVRLQACHSLRHCISAVNASYAKGVGHYSSDCKDDDNSSLCSSLQAVTTALTARLSDSQACVRQAAACTLWDIIGVVKDMVAKYCSNDVQSELHEQLQQQVQAAKTAQDDSATAHTLDKVLNIV